MKILAWIATIISGPFHRDRVKHTGMQIKSSSVLMSWPKTSFQSERCQTTEGVTISTPFLGTFLIDVW